jgi:hypothetical protein
MLHGKMIMCNKATGTPSVQNKQSVVKVYILYRKYFIVYFCLNCCNNYRLCLFR